MTSKNNSYRYLSNHATIKIEKLTDTIPAMHEHEYIEFVYILSGTAQHFVDGKYNTIVKGNYFIIDYKHSICIKMALKIFKELTVHLPLNL